MQNVGNAILNSTSDPVPPRMCMRLDEPSLQKLLKRELRLSILSKRRVRRECARKEEYPTPLLHEIDMADVERKERRREQNRIAAQRCRRKKRINQLSVLQNYEWIISRNQNLQQEVDQLRQEMTRLNSLLKAHRNACTCAHTQKGPLHVLSANVKVEPTEDCPGQESGYRTPPPPLPLPMPPPPAFVSRCLSMGSCQYESPANENSLVDSMHGASVLQQQHKLGGGQTSCQLTSCYASPTQAMNQQTTPYGSPMQIKSQQHTPPYHASRPIQSDCQEKASNMSPRCHENASYMSPKGQENASYASPSNYPATSSSCSYQPHENDLKSRYSLQLMEECPQNMQVPVHNRDHLQGGFTSSVPTTGFGGSPHSIGLNQMDGSLHPHLSPQDSGTHLSLLDDLTGMTSGVKSCIFQSKAATPLSADNRRSISSMSSDASGGSELPEQDAVVGTTETPTEVPLGDFYLTDEVPPHDVSQLLSQINQSDLLFQQEGGMDEVFTDQVVGIASLPQHFLHSL